MKTIKIKSDKIITENGLFNGFLYLKNGKIIDVSDIDLKADEFYDFTGKFVAPGFIDMHTHGAGGHSFLTSDSEEIIKGCDFHLAHGTTTILPTVSAAPFETMKASVKSIKTAIESKKSKANILGAHLEGPYLNASQCGAQSPDFITAPKENEYIPLINEYGKYIARWTFAPENDNGDFCAFLTKDNIVSSIGHSNATLNDVDIAIKNGCNLVTHLYSCTSTVTRNKGFRSLGVIESAFLRDDLFVEIIADGKHLPKELVQIIIKIKSKEKVALITDSLEIAGTDIKEGIMAKTEFIVEDGVCKLKDRSAFAGSIATADLLVKFMVNIVKTSVCDAVYMLSTVPARILNINKGVLAQGFDADITVFDDNIDISAVFVGGIRQA